MKSEAYHRQCVEELIKNEKDDNFQILSKTFRSRTKLIDKGKPLLNIVSDTAKPKTVLGSI